VFEDKIIDSPEASEEGEQESSSSSGEEESSSEEDSSSEEGESSSEGSSPEKKAVLAAAVVGAAAAGGAALADKEDEPDIELGIDDPPTEELENETAGPPPESLEDDIVNPDEMGEQINLADEEYRNEVLPPQQDEEQGLLQLNNKDESVAAAMGAPLSPIAEKSVEKDDPSFSSAATAKASGAGGGNNGNSDEERVVSSSRNDSCWKRHKCLMCFIILMILFIIAAVVFVVLLLFGPWKHPASQENPTSQDKTTTTTTMNRCEVVNLGPFYQNECESCSYTVAMDFDTGLIASAGEGRGDETIQFLSNAGTYVPEQNLPYILHEESAVLGNYAALGERHAGNGIVYMYEKNSTGVWNNVANITPVTLNA